MFAGREEGKLLPFVMVVTQPSSLCRVRNVRRPLGELRDGIHVDVIHAGRSKSARENVQPSLGKETHGKCLFVVCSGMIRFL
jgi:hypothetical protein